MGIFSDFVWNQFDVTTSASFKMSEAVGQGAMFYAKVQCFAREEGPMNFVTLRCVVM